MFENLPLAESAEYREAARVRCNRCRPTRCQRIAFFLVGCSATVAALCAFAIARDSIVESRYAGAGLGNYTAGDLFAMIAIAALGILLLTVPTILYPTVTTLRADISRLSSRLDEIKREIETKRARLAVETNAEASTI